MRRTFIARGFGEPAAGVTRQRLARIPALYGEVVAFEKIEGGRRVTVVPGFHIKDLPAVEGCACYEVESVSGDQKYVVSGVLKLAGYEPPFVY